jgi:pimeloyl-ACP methyl ester carboxylesterase
LECPARNRVQLNGRSYALLSGRRSCTTQIVFVHGFMGCSEKTWLQFQTLPDRLSDPWWHDCDLFFYSYDSTGTQLWPNIASLESFLKDAFPKPEWESLGLQTAGPRKEYRNIILVGHSEGAVLIRGAILQRARSYAAGSKAGLAKRIQQDKLLQAGVCLFAPALFGSLICGWMGVLLKSPVLGDLVECYLNKAPAYKQLNENSPILQQIREETIHWATTFPDLNAFKARSLFAVKDSVASIASLSTDFPSEFDPGQTHASICKPSTMYLRPLTFVRDTKYAIAA